MILTPTFSSSDGYQSYIEDLILKHGHVSIGLVQSDGNEVPIWAVPIHESYAAILRTKNPTDLGYYILLNDPEGWGGLRYGNVVVAYLNKDGELTAKTSDQIKDGAVSMTNEYLNKNYTRLAVP